MGMLQKYTKMETSHSGDEAMSFLQLSKFYSGIKTSKQIHSLHEDMWKQMGRDDIFLPFDLVSLS